MGEGFPPEEALPSIHTGNWDGWNSRVSAIDGLCNINLMKYVRNAKKSNYKKSVFMRFALKGYFITHRLYSKYCVWFDLISYCYIHYK